MTAPGRATGAPPSFAPGSVLTIDQVALVAVASGFARDPGGGVSPASIATAIAMAESGGNSGATHDNSNGSQDRGLWQINTIHGPFGDWRNPFVNGAKAHQIFIASKGFKDWVTYSGAGLPPGTRAPYLEYLIPATAAVNKLPANVQAGGISTNNGAAYTEWLHDLFKSWYVSIGFPEAASEAAARAAARGTPVDAIGRGVDAVVDLPGDLISGAIGIAAPYLWIGGGVLCLTMGVLLIAKGNK